MNGHTEGPWMVLRNHTCHTVKTQRDWGDGGRQVCNVPKPQNPESAANAHLIAAAPDMYAVLKSMESVDNDPMAPGDPRRALLLAAIAKAEGK